VSHALGKLREELHDPLFVRTGSEMVPTARTQAVVAAVRKMSDELDLLFKEGTHFVPSEYRGSLTIAFSNLAAGFLSGRLLERLRHAAPHARLSVRRVTSHDVVGLLDDASIDLAVGRFSLDAANILRRKLLSDRPVCVTRASHSTLQHVAALDVDTYFALDHVDALEAELADSSPLDPELQARALQRKVHLTVPDVSWALEISASTDLVTTVPRSTAVHAAGRHQLRVFELPFETSLRGIDELWHERHHTDPVNVWLRSVVRATAANLELALVPSDSSQSSAA
jgi:DNA-binding transcriptional LysR family regulator